MVRSVFEPSLDPMNDHGQIILDKTFGGVLILFLVFQNDNTYPTSLWLCHQFTLL